MSDLVLRARTPVETLDAAVTLFRRHAAQYITVAAAIVVPFAVLQLMVGAPDPTGESVDIGAQLLNLVVTFIGYALTSAAVTVLGAAAYRGEPLDPRGALRAALPAAPRVIAATVAQWLLIVVGFFGLIIGGFWVTAMTFALLPAIVLERRGVSAAFSRSAALSRGRKRHILATIFLGGLAYAGVAIVVSLAGLFTRNAVFTLLLTTLVQLVAYPIFALVYTVLYYDSRIRLEGYDLEVLEGSLAPVAAP